VTDSGNELEKLGRSSWAAEEFKRLEGTRGSEEDSRDAFLRVKGAADLTRRQLALLRELVIWRDEVAGGRRSGDVSRRQQ
jgi:ribonuclease D